MGFCWWADDGSLLVVFGPLPLIILKKKKKKKKNVGVGPLWQNFLDPRMQEALCCVLDQNTLSSVYIVLRFKR